MLWGRVGGFFVVFSFFVCEMYVPVDGLGWKWISHFYTSIFIEKYLKY